MATASYQPRTFIVTPPPPARQRGAETTAERNPSPATTTPLTVKPAPPIKPRCVARGNGPLYERYRPRKWREIVGQDAALKKLELLRKSQAGLSGRAYYLAGISGCGKSTIAYCLANHIADKWGIEEIDAKGLNSTRIQEIERGLWNRFIGEGGKTGRAVLINEAHCLAKDAIGQLLTTLEGARIPPHAIWVFTTTLDGQKTMFDGKIDAFPFISRCVRLELSADVALAFADRAREIALAEGLDGGKDRQWFIKYVEQRKRSMRDVLYGLECGDAL